MMTVSSRAAAAASLLLALLPATLLAQGPKARPPGPMLDGGRVTLQAKNLQVELLRYSGTVARLSPGALPAFDYTPGDLLRERSANTFYHLGDLDLRMRSGDATGWTDYSTAYRREAARVLVSTPTELSEDISSSLASAPLDVVRTWIVVDGQLRLRFTLTNHSSQPVQLGGVGFAMVFDNIMTGRTLAQSYATCSFYDPYIGEDAGYVKVNRLTGTGPVLLIVPEQHTAFEAWKPILDHRSRATGEGLLLNDPTPRSATFEGSYDWMVHSEGFADTDWKGVKEWNTPTEDTLAPGAGVTYGLRFLVAPSLRGMEATLAANGRPVAVGIPGYVLPQDMAGTLFLRAASPVRSIVSEPVGALSIHHDGPAPDPALDEYTLRGLTWGRSRLRITYNDGTVQTIGYWTTKPERTVVADLGHFLFTEQWFDQPDDPFHRSPSIISYDDQAHAQIRQEPRVWIAGLSDEGGAGSWIAAAMKEYLEPDPAEVAKLEDFVNQTVWGQLQVSSGPEKYGVHKSLFYYQPDAMPTGTYNPEFDWSSWTSWNRKGAVDVGRTYNYPHVIAAYWSLYRIARYSHGVATQKPWQWYLNQAYQTTMAMRAQAPYYTQFGLMEGTVLVHLLNDLKSEGWTDKASAMEQWMQQRTAHWKTEAYPFGSEMPWDSTGQEEVYDWTHYFGDTAKADVTLNAILAYVPVEPSWGYNGSARRFWDFLYAGKWPRIERQLHHYGSGLNAIPLMTEYRSHPGDLYLLRAGYGGIMGPLTNINQQGFASAAFHSFPDKMQFDPYSGDYGPNFLGFSLNTGAYLVHDPAMGWIAFGGNVAEHHGRITLTVLDASRQRVYIAPEGLWLTLDAGRFDTVEYDPKTHRVTASLAPATAYVSTAKLHISRPGEPGVSQAPMLRTIALGLHATQVGIPR